MHKIKEHENQSSAQPEFTNIIHDVAQTSQPVHSQSKGQRDGNELGLAADHSSLTYPKSKNGFKAVKTPPDEHFISCEDSFKNFNVDEPNGSKELPGHGPSPIVQEAKAIGKRCKQSNHGSWPPLARVSNFCGNFTWRSKAHKQFQTESLNLNGLSSKINPLNRVQIQTKLQNVKTIKPFAPNVTNSPLLSQIRIRSAQSVTLGAQRGQTNSPHQNQLETGLKNQDFHKQRREANQTLHQRPQIIIQSDKSEIYEGQNSDIAYDQNSKHQIRDSSRDFEAQAQPDGDKSVKENEDSRSLTDLRQSDDSEKFDEKGQPRIQSLCFKCNLSDDTPKVTKIPKFVPEKQICCSARKRITDGGLQLNLSSASGSKDLNDSNQLPFDVIQPIRAPGERVKTGRKRQKKRNKKPQGSQVQVPSIVFSLDFLDDDDVIQQITPKNVSKPLQHSLFKHQHSKSFVWMPQLSSQSSKSGDSLQFFVDKPPKYSQEVSDKQNKQQENSPESPNLPFDLEFLTSDQVKNFDKFQSLQNQNDNDSAKLNVSLQSSEENKILEQNGGDLIQLKSSPMMRPRTYRAQNSSSPPANKKQEESEEEELTHELIMMKLIKKLQNESKSPTKLKVQENLQRNINFYEEYDQRQIHQMYQGQPLPPVLHPQPQYGFNPQHQPFSFQLNPCFDMPGPMGQNIVNPVINHQNNMNFQQSAFQHPMGSDNYGMVYPNMPQQNLLIQQQQQLNQGQQHLMMNQQQQQYHNGFCSQGDTQVPMMPANIHTNQIQPMMMTDMDNEMRQLPINIQYALLTNEEYMRRQFHLQQMYKQHQMEPMQHQQPPHLQPQTQMPQLVNQQMAFGQEHQQMMGPPSGPPANGGFHQQHHIGGMQPQMMNQPQLPHQQYSSLQFGNPQPMQNSSNMYYPNVQQQIGSLSQDDYENQLCNQWLMGQSKQELLQSLQNSMVNQFVHQEEQKNRHRLAFEINMRPIGFDTEATIHGFQWKESAFKINPRFTRLFNKRDESESASKSRSSDKFSSFGSPQKYNGSPEAVGRSQSIFSESTYQSPKRKPTAGSNRLLQMTVNVNQMFDKVYKYKRAREKYLEEIRRNKTQVDYIQTKSENSQAAQQQQIQNELRNDSNENLFDNPIENSKLSLFTQELSFGKNQQSSQNDHLNDYSGLGKNENIVEQDDELFEERLRWDRKNSKRYPRDKYEEVGIGSGGEYVLKENQIIVSPENVKYKIVQYLGQGTFGQVVKCINLQKGTEHAVKIIKNKTEFILQGMVEIKILEKLNNSPYRTEFEKQHLIKMEDYFVFRDYLCIVFELLSSSLYERIQESDRGLSLSNVREYTRQILEALVTCKQSNLIHCDLKPENILLAKDGFNVKLIDFGSATFNGHQVYTYIQSRYYRAPEVLMGCQKYPTHNIFSGEMVQPVPLYDQSIDMWSLACTAIEMFIKIPIFPGKYDYDQLLKILEFCGEPSQHMILNSQNRERFFYFNLQQQRYVFKTFYDFVWTMVPPHMQDKVEQPMNYHQHYNFLQLLEQHFISQLRKEKCEKYMAQQREMAKDNKNHCFIPPNFDFEYKYEDKIQILQFIDFIQQILQIDQTKRLTPLQALSHPFITGLNVPLPFIPAPEIQLRHFRKANLQQPQDQNFSLATEFEFPEVHGQGVPLPLSQSQRSISAPLPKRFSVWDFFKNIEQKNGQESFRPPINALPENIFYGNCCDTNISEFYQESKIRFQIHQDENVQQVDIDKQRSLLQNHKFCDIDFQHIDSHFQNQHEDTLGEGGFLKRKKTESLESDEFDRKSSISILEIQRQKSIMQIKEDKSIRQPKVTESEKFIREFFEREVIQKVANEAVKRAQKRMKEEMKEGEMQQAFFEFYQESHNDSNLQSIGQKVVKQWDEGNKQQVDRTLSSVDFIDDSQLLSQPRKVIFFKKEKQKERSNSSDTIQKQQSQQPEISLFSKNPIIQEENHNGSRENIPSPISSINNSGEAKSQSSLDRNTQKQQKLTGSFKFKSQLQSSAACKIEKNLQDTKPTLKYSNFIDSAFGESSLKEQEKDIKKKKHFRNKKKKSRHGKIQTPLKHDGFPEFEDHSDNFLDDKACRFGSTPAAEFAQQTGSQSQCVPFSKHFSKKSSSAFADPDGAPSHSGSDFDTEHDTDYGKQLDKKDSENNEGCLTNFKGSTSLRNNTFSNNNSFENPDYLDQLSGSIKEMAQNNCGEDDKSPELGGIACLRPKRSVKKNKKKKH